MLEKEPGFIGEVPNSHGAHVHVPEIPGSAVAPPPEATSASLLYCLSNFLIMPSLSHDP